MNLHKGKRPVPLRVLMVNPLAPASQMIAMKILSGSIFGTDQMIDLSFLVYYNEVDAAEALKLAMDACAYSHTNSINVSTTLPRYVGLRQLEPFGGSKELAELSKRASLITDADVFCFVTNFQNPNFIDFEQTETDAQFDTLYLLLKLAHNFSLHPPLVEKPPAEDIMKPIKENPKEVPKRIRPIFIADGLVALDILMSFSKYIPYDVLYCPTSLGVIAKSVMGDFLKVSCDVINDVLVWAANDKVFHVDIEEPCLTYDTIADDLLQTQCTWRTMSSEIQEKLNVDHTQFNSTWMKTNFINMIAEVASRHPYGGISKASEFSKTLREIWKQRTNSDDKQSYANFGIISDGSLGTIKGCPYIMPVLFKDDTWMVDNRKLNGYSTTYLQYEIKRMNKAVKEHHTKLIKHCKLFLAENVINQAFIPSDEVSSSFTDSEKIAEQGDATCRCHDDSRHVITTLGSY